MPDDLDNEELIRSRARQGLDAYGKPFPKPVVPPPKPTIKFTKSFTKEELNKQAAAKSQALRAHFNKEEDYE